MNKKKVGTTKKVAAERTYKRPSWVDSAEEELCPDCFKVVGSRSRYQLVCLLGKAKEGMTVTELTAELELQQPTITHHLNVLRSVDAVASIDSGRERIYSLNRDAHCFDECKIPY
ncbi:metalloregulator ArsR/SmtB family transcription factor [Patescibacteria group bacterium]|nr:metalloregulator ArsR/SmtB family transcription factor [Patescibacteria group bacterium]MBU1500487.1 metalloregulator ArsR/SmtB family transcription factor [Patescibacteria group bacterium]MBU2080715.1 metalloregulator ArsR/SmtB family transcription factor [Patescibacteria group bacterium]MBU2123820.1 metalloregulator ArsR/SmtB family transcription factor [Patescibacteria group bacterium]MBU2194889.1 metalloregulator ArsR/SmtB family transcription factor [Patescibacteria group bacterium]